jgi:hypothetical protein
MSREIQKKLDEEARHLKAAEARAASAIAVSDMNSLCEAIFEFAEARKNILMASADLDVIQVYDSNTREVLERLRGGKRYLAHTVAEAVERHAKDGTVLTSFSPQELDDLGHELLYSWLTHFEYAESLLDTASLLVGVHLPEDLVRYVKEARRCLAFRQCNAVVSLCRTIMESAARDANRRRGRARNKVEDISSGGARRRVIEAAPRHLNGEVLNLYHYTSELIHARKTASREEARDILARTLRAVSAFYDGPPRSRPTRR